MFVGHFCTPGSESGLRIRIRTRIQGPHWIRIHQDDTDPDPQQWKKRLFLCQLKKLILVIYWEVTVPDQCSRWNSRRHRQCLRSTSSLSNRYQIISYYYKEIKQRKIMKGWFNNLHTVEFYLCCSQHQWEFIYYKRSIRSVEGTLSGI